MMLRPYVVDFSFIVTHAHQKIKALFCCINFDYITNFVKKCFVFLSIFFFYFECKKRKQKYTLNSIILENLLYCLFNYDQFYEPFELWFYF